MLKGKRSTMIGRMSAHAAQYAAGAISLDERKPSPPCMTGMKAIRRALARYGSSSHAW